MSCSVFNLDLDNIISEIPHWVCWKGREVQHAQLLCLLKWTITSNHLNYHFHIPQVLFDDSARKDRTILMDRLLHGLSNIFPSNTNYILNKLKSWRRWNDWQTDISDCKVAFETENQFDQFQMQCWMGKLLVCPSIIFCYISVSKHHQASSSVIKHHQASCEWNQAFSCVIICHNVSSWVFKHHQALCILLLLWMDQCFHVGNFFYCFLYVGNLLLSMEDVSTYLV